ncbi:MAG: hydrogenase 3 maturation endopeptidase HyCI [Methanocorpusculum sp.]|nr:hydrogenase 3 maturation endopeptidase HyCI [Methanocorpusculum sp.]
MVSLIVFGVGNTLSTDDGAGPAAAKRLASRGFTAFDCGTAPENFCGVLRSARPDVLAVIDAAGMALPAGAVRRIPPEKIAEVSIGTHMLSLGFFLSYVQELCGRAVILGIQPADLSEGEGLTAAVSEAVETVCRAVEEGRIDEIAEL